MKKLCFSIALVFFMTHSINACNAFNMKSKFSYTTMFSNLVNNNFVPIGGQGSSIPPPPPVVIP